MTGKRPPALKGSGIYVPGAMRKPANVPAAQVSQGDLFGSMPSSARTAAVAQQGKLSLSKLSSSSTEPRPEDRAPPQKGTEFEEISATVTRAIFLSKDGSGVFGVYAVKGKKGLKTKITVTTPAAFSQGDRILAKGSWSTYKGTPTFRAVMAIHEIPKGARGVVTWLKTKAASGVGAATAEKLAKHFGDRLPEIIDKPEVLVEAGIPAAKAEAIAEAWTSNASQPELVEHLGRLGLGEMTIGKIVKRYGAAARRIIQNNPWVLAETISGIGFQKADEIAREAGHPKDSPKRIAAGLRYALEDKTGREGHCCLTRELLVEEATRLLALPRNLVEEGADAVIEDGSVVLDSETGLIYPKGLHECEQKFAERLMQLMENGGRIPERKAREAVEAAVEEMKVNRDESQIEAAVMAVSSPLSIITGGPGTGKSTTQRIIVRAFEMLGLEVVLAAPTGRAAKRLAEVSGRGASTCHRLLSFSAEKGGFEHDHTNPFDEDRIIIDEFSMVDIRLGQAFMDAVKKDGGVTIVGDVDQLPSVGPGQVLRDLIEAGAIPVARLKTVHRQSDDSGIVVAAARINSGQHPTGEERLDGFEVVSDLPDSGSHDAVRTTVVSLMTEILKERGFDPIQDVQVLSPMRKGELGITLLNEELKAALNPARDDGRSTEIRKRVFSIGDRVMHLRNDYAKKVYNGEVGTVAHVGTRKNDDNRDEPYIMVDYSGYKAWYGPNDIDDVELAWAATVHKSQGCEFPVVIFVCPDAHRRMLTRNLLYTAVTRAKKLCIVVGHESALMHAVSTADVNSRFTGLAKRLPPPAPEQNQGFWPSM